MRSYRPRFAVRFVRPFRVFALAVAGALPLAACDGEDPAGGAFDPDAVDYDEVRSTDFGDYVQPLLAARNVFAPAATDAPGAPADYAWQAIFDGAEGETIVPFDGEGSFLVRFVEDLADSTAIPYPNLRRLEDDELRYLKRWIEGGARDDEGQVPYADAEHLLYACEQGQNSVAILDMARRRVIRRVYFAELGVPSQPYGPHHVAFEPDGSAWYVSLINGGADGVGRVLKLSTGLTTDPGTAPYLLAQSPPFRTPGMLALDATSSRLYVGRSTLSQSGTPNLGVFDRTTLSLVEEVPTPFDVPHALALTPDGRYVLTASLTGNVAAVMATADFELQLFPLAGPPRELIHFGLLAAHHGPAAHAGHAAGSAMAPQHAYEATLTSRTTDEVLFFNVAETGALTMTGSAPAGDGPFHAHAGADGRTILIPDWFGNAVTLLDARTHQARTLANPPGGPLAQPHSPAPGMGDGVLWVSSANRRGEWAPAYRFLGEPGPGGVRQPLANDQFGNVAALDEATGAVVTVIQLGAYPSGLEHRMDHGAHGAAPPAGGHEHH